MNGYAFTACFNGVLFAGVFVGWMLGMAQNYTLMFATLMCGYSIMLYDKNNELIMLQKRIDQLTERLR